MYVKNKMNTDVVSIFPDASISLAFQLMHEKDVSHLPVEKEGRLVGLLTETLLGEVTPSKATSLSIYELNYILEKTKVADIMAKQVITCQEEMLIEDVALLMTEHDVNMVPVIDANQQLKGIITRNDMIDSFIEILGVRDHGSRITLLAENQAGTIEQIARLIHHQGHNITHISNFNNSIDNQSEIIIRLDEEIHNQLKADLEKAGFHILRID